MRKKDFFKSKYINGSDFVDEEPRTYIVQSVGLEEVGPNKEKKVVVYFEGVEQSWVLNGVNWETIERSYGDTENWRGRPIELFGAPVDFQGKTEPGVRCRIPKPRNSPGSPAGTSSPVNPPSRSHNRDEPPPPSVLFLWMCC